MKSPLVSVIIPCYMQARLLPECIASLQAQTYVHWRAIIVDDGSPDDTLTTARSLASNDPRVMVVQQSNGGLSSARNFGLGFADGDYVQFLDADDLLLPGKFQAHLEAVRKSTPQTVTYTDYFHGDSEDPSVRVEGVRVSCQLVSSRPLLDFAARWEHDFSIPIHAALFPRALLLQMSPLFDASLRNHEDWDMWMRLAAHAAEFTFIPVELAIYRYGAHSMSRSDAEMWRGFDAAIKKQLALLSDDGESLRCLNYLRHINNRRHSGWQTKWWHALAGFSSLLQLPPRLQERLFRGRLPLRRGHRR